MQPERRSIKGGLLSARFAVEAVAILSLMVGLGATGLVTRELQRSVHREKQKRFDRIADRLATEVQGRVNAVTNGLRAIRGLFVASQTVERGEFRKFNSQLHLESEFPGALGFGFIERVRRDELRQFVEAQREDEAPEFTVRGGGSQEDLYIVKFIEPIDSNREAEGLDLSDDPARRTAAERAARTGAATLSGRVTLIQDQRRRPGFLYMLPIYQNGTDPQTVWERERSLVGLAYAPVVAEAAFAGLYESGDGLIDVDVFDGRNLNETSIMVDTGLDEDAPAGGSYATEYGGRMFHTIRHIAMGGREWTLVLSTTPKFESSVENRVAGLAALGGGVLSLLLATVIWALGTGRMRALALARDMTSNLASAKTRAEAALREAEALRRTVDEHSIVTVADARGRIREVNDMFCKISGYSREELIGQDHRIVNSGHHSKDFWVHMRKRVASGKSWRGEVCNLAKNGVRFWVDTIIAPFTDADGKIEKYVSLRTDITERKLAEEELRTAARTDKLTTLPNRTLLYERLQRAVQRTRSPEGHRFAVLFLDIDRFKIINDSLGHDIGDLLLQQIAERLQSAVRATDPLTRHVGGSMAARLGGDEFVLLLENITSTADATSVAERLLAQLSKPYRLGEYEVYSTGSIGIVTSDTLSSSAEEVLRNADIAMYEAKEAGKARYVVFDASMHERVSNRLALENDLRQALDLGQLFVVYQPIVSLQSGRVENYEALLRWQHPTRGLVMPTDFIPIAEDTGLITSLGEWVVRQACRQFAQWQREWGKDAPLAISVNVSRAQLVLSDLPETVREILQETDVAPECLHLEVTESAVMSDADRSRRVLEMLKDVGVKLAMDDFGTGYSSLASLHQFPVDILKIDRLFVADLSRGRDFVALVHAVAQLAHNLGVTIVAEGIETNEQLALLQSLDCEYGQGLLFSEPLEAAEVARYHPQQRSVLNTRAAVPPPVFAATS